MKNTTKCEIVKYDKKESVKELTESRRLEEVNSLFNFQGFLEENLEGDHGGVAQLGEHLPCKQGVMGSNPIISTIVPRLNGLIAQLVRARA